ncbi:hypothetical protein N7520_009666 [Penicillium odoratum]|uniref:uncharacterized protein n=1 Tax=Penicillium odoratum TaxID=1167516 RepID=UPI002549048E|nr:uncharacterized protein N7520_009666 [Penicillium odoratum]KAJ5752749.1 hypothetical protein N7520_009666 [Penicillium odoratum]
MATHQLSTACDINGPLRIRNGPSDTVGSPSTASTVTTLSELSHTPSLDFSDREEDDANQTSDCVTFKEPLNALPGWEMIDKLKARYFAFVFPLFCTFSFVQFEDEYRSFRQNPDGAPLSWLSLLFAILALACRAEEVPERACLFDRLSMAYEKAAWDCLSLNNPPFEPSTAALKAFVLVIYGRVHRGIDVSRDLHTAYQMATSTSYHRRPTQSMACEENKTLWIALKMLLFMNGQLHSDPCDQEVSQNLYLMAGIDWKESLEMQHLPMSFEDSSLSVMDFTVLQSRVLTISDIIDASKKYGFLSSWSLPGVVSELSRIENDCNQFYAGPYSSDSQGELCKVKLGILRYCIQYLLQSAHFPSFESYLDGDITSDTQSAAEKCIDSATSANEISFILSTANMTTPPNISPHQGEQPTSDMEITGFVVFSASSEGPDMSAEVKRGLHSRPRVERDPLVYGRGDPNTCKRFMRHGADENNAFANKITEAIGDVDFLLRQGPVIVHSTEDHSTWGTRLAHPSREAVSAFRDLARGDEAKVVFKLYPLDLPREATLVTRPVVRKLQPHEILFVKGTIRMEIEMPAGGCFVWQGNSGDPMGYDMLGSEVFEFMMV